MRLELEKLSRRDLFLVRWLWYYIYAVIRAGRHTQQYPPLSVSVCERVVALEVVVVDGVLDNKIFYE